MQRTQEWWDHWFLGLARYISTASKDPSTQCGAVIVDEDRRVISLGYNGFPKGMKDDCRLNDRGKKYEITCHAESNAIDFARADLLGCDIYTWPIQPCSRCAARIIQNNITRVVAPYMDTASEIGLRHQFSLALEMFNEVGLSVTLYTEGINATQEGLIQGSGQSEHQGRESRRRATETSGSDRPEQSGQKGESFQEAWERSWKEIERRQTACGAPGPQ